MVCTKPTNMNLDDIDYAWIQHLRWFSKEGTQIWIKHWPCMLAIQLASRRKYLDDAKVATTVGVRHNYIWCINCSIKGHTEFLLSRITKDHIMKTKDPSKKKTIYAWKTLTIPWRKMSGQLQNCSNIIFLQYLWKIWAASDNWIPIWCRCN